jgi:hypothetical protein
VNKDDASRANFPAASLRAFAPGTLYTAARYLGGMNFPALIEPVLRGHFI